MASQTGRAHQFPNAAAPPSAVISASPSYFIQPDNTRAALSCLPAVRNHWPVDTCIKVRVSTSTALQNTTSSPLRRNLNALSSRSTIMPRVLLFENIPRKCLSVICLVGILKSTTKTKRVPNDTVGFNSSSHYVRRCGAASIFTGVLYGIRSICRAF